MTFRTRALIFSTFFGSCIAIALLLFSLTTNHWVRAYPRRGNSTDAKGEVNFGLFYGNKELDYGFSPRTYSLYVTEFMRTEPESMNFWLWLITSLGTGFGLLGCAIAAVASVCKAASKHGGTMALLFASNISAAISQVLAFVCWLVQFFQYLTHNVLAKEDHKRHWYSEGFAYLGYSFYLVIAATLVVMLNICVLLYVKHCEQRDRRHRFVPPSEEKNQGEIMLY